jgi:catechol 2,3-dioxygenase-like lactoylglutathione lyase family enzyme
MMPLAYCAWHVCSGLRRFRIQLGLYNARNITWSLARGVTVDKSSVRFTGSAAVLLVRDVQKALEHYRDALGFTPIVATPEPPTFALLRRGEGAVVLQHADDPSVIVPYWTVQSKTSNVYFWVDDAESLYEEYQGRGGKDRLGAVRHSLGDARVWRPGHRWV